MEVYLDNSATTKPFKEVVEIMVKTMEEDYGNPSSVHMKGIFAEKYIKEAKEKISKELKVESKEIYFTSGGTESNNLAIIGTAMANKRQGNHIITSCIEHPSVYNTMFYLEEQGFRVTYLPVDEKGIVDLEILKNSICDDTILISIMYVNNEVGAVEPIEEIAKIIKNSGKNIIFHVDAIQAFGKYRIYPKRIGIDLLSISGHKIHSSKGIGVLYIKDRLKIKPIIFGGEQQKGLRSGTENVPAIAGIGVATELIYKDFNKKHEKLNLLKNTFIDKVMQIKNIRNNSGLAPHIISISFIGVRSEVLLHALEDRGIFVSAGSACSSNHPAISGTLKGMNVPQECLDSTLRFSLCEDNEIEEIDYTIEVLKEIVPKLRKFIRK